MKYETALHHVEFFAFHGLYPEEKVLGGTFVVDLRTTQEIDDDASLKRLADLVNYEQLFDIAKKEMDNPRDLIETVAKSMLDQVASKIHHLQSAEVKITKLNPGGLFKSGSASVSLSRIF